MDLANGLVQATSFNTLNIASENLELKVHADLFAERMDTINVTNTTTEAGKIKVTNIKLLSDTPKTILTMAFTDDSLKEAVSYTGGEVAYSEI